MADKKIDLKQLGGKVNQFVADAGSKMGESAKGTVQKSKKIGAGQ